MRHEHFFETCKLKKLRFVSLLSLIKFIIHELPLILLLERIERIIIKL